MRAEFPEAFEFLFEPARYKVAYGGRGAGKSQSFARALLIQGAQKPLRILCTRELQKSISDSVHKLLSDQIVALGLQSCYTVEKAHILGANGTEFLFSGLKNSASLKSYESIDRCWCEEGSVISKASWDVLLPTIRKEGSEIWISMNPSLASDNSHVRWVLNPPPGAVVRKINYDQNPWFPKVLRDEMEHLLATDEASYRHVWLGECVSVVAGSIYENELRAVDLEKRITRIPYDQTRVVNTFWDIGVADHTAIWFAQPGAFEYRIIDYLESSRHPLAWYLKELQNKPYLYGSHYLPWDARPKQFGSGRSVEELMIEAGFKVEIVTKLSVEDGINAARTIFPQCYFDGEKCADGLQALRHYRYGRVEKLGVSTRQPLHDVNSHGSDAFRYFAIGVRQPEREAPYEDDYGGGGSWMG